MRLSEHENSIGLSSFPSPFQVCALVIACNGRETLPRTLKSIAGQTYPIRSVILVDNGSTDGSQEIFLSHFPNGILIRNPNNEGFARAANQGISFADADGILLLNQDVELFPDYVERLVNALKTEGDSVGASGLLITPDGKIDSAGHTAYRDRVVEDRYQKYPIPSSIRLQQEKVFGIPATASLYRLSLLLQLAFQEQIFDESFFSYLEDVDLDYRANLLGYSFLFVPEAKAIHFSRASRRSFQVQWRAHKNYLLLLFKYETLTSLLLDLPEIGLFLGYRFIRTLFNDPRLLLADFLLLPLIPRIWQWRGYLRSARKMTLNHLRSRMTPCRLLRKILLRYRAGGS